MWICHKFLCSIFSKVTQLFDSFKHSIIWKLAYKVKYISQINRSLITFFGNSRIRLFLNKWLDCEQYGKNQYKKKEYGQLSSMFKVLRYLSYYLNVTEPVISNDFYLFILLWKSSWQQRIQSWKFRTLSWITNHNLLSQTLYWDSLCPGRTKQPLQRMELQKKRSKKRFKHTINLLRT